MKKFAVLKKVGDYNADVVREFGERQAWVAADFAEALQASEDKQYIEYYVAVVYPVDEWRIKVTTEYCGCAADPQPEVDK